MSLSIYNTLTRKKEEFTPRKKGRVSIYVCGPTVYDEPHIGHARAAFTFDIIRRYLKFKGYKIKFVRNVTDVDDKIIDRAVKERGIGDIKSAVREISQKYLDSYHKAMDKLGILKPDIEPRATGEIKGMIKMVQALIRKGFAYESGGDVYFSVRKFDGYGKLSSQSLEMLESGSRVAQGEKKQDALDFALWKRSKEGEPSWKSPWGEGRPGWHIECSVMSSKYLGDEFDIHGGGLDLIFPHHENEIAQSEASSGKGFAKYWLHNGLLTINNQKMSKSVGNFISTDDFFKRHNPDVLKTFFLSAHYRGPIDFSWEKMDETSRALERFDILFGKIQKIGVSRGKNRKAACKEVEELKKRFIEAMDDDFNTAVAIGVLHDGVSTANKILDDAKIPDEEKADRLIQLEKIIRQMGGLFGLFERGAIVDRGGEVELVERLKEVATELKSKGYIEQDDLSRGLKSKTAEDLIRWFIDLRSRSRRDKKFELSDRIREDLHNCEVVLEDNKDGSTGWRRR
ncbi:MAG: cysteine--tRNA ligase [Candidatus Omnitrophica bacterium]|nr:cysteine--tRNA ligase [Candidatus Omnitrophota bacterium]